MKTFSEIFEAHLLEKQEKEYKAVEKIIFNEIYEKYRRKYLLEKFYREYELEKMFEDIWRKYLRDIEEEKRQRLLLEKTCRETCLLREAVITPKNFGINVENYLTNERDLNEKTIRNAIFKVIDKNHKAYDPFVIRSSGNNDVNNLNHTLIVATENYRNFIVQRLNNRIHGLNQDLKNNPTKRQQFEKEIALKTYDMNNILVDPEWANKWFDSIHLTDQRLLEPNVLKFIRKTSKDLYANLPKGFDLQ